MRSFLFNLTLSIFLFSISAFSQQNNFKTLKLENEVKTSFKNNNDGLELSSSLQNNSRKSPALAIIYSLLLPGMGELYADSYSSGKYFTIAEGALWGVFFGMNTYGNWQRDQYKSYAQSTGGVNPNGKNSDFYATIADYQSVYEYNNIKALDREFTQMLDPSQNYWQWPSTTDRKAYRTLWTSSEQTFNNVRFVVGAMIVNRIISAINAVRLVAAYNKNQSTETSWSLSAGISSQVNLPPSLTLNFQKNF
jgi:hypothetical protein